ncbi:hypothetical protein ACFL6R_00775 [Gemmatimonadota bacterium]
MRSRILFFFLALALPAICAAQESAPPFPWRFVDPLRIDTDNPEALVGDLRSRTIDGYGRVSLLCLRSHIIHRFDAEGKWAGNIDRRGQGPGDFESPGYISASPEGDLLILDTRLIRLTHLTWEGEYVTSINLSIPGLDVFIEPRIAFGSDSTYWLVHRKPQEDRSAPITRVISLFDQTGKVLWKEEYTDLSVDIFVELSNRQGSITVTNPARYIVRCSFDSDGTAWIISPDCGQLMRVSGLGEVLGTIDLDLPPPTITAGEWRNYLRSLEPEDRTDEANREVSSRRIDAIRKLRDDLPPIQYTSWVGEAGLLIDRYGRFRGPDTSMQRITALLPDGRLTSDYENPGIQFANFSQGFLLASDYEYGELPRLTRYRIEPIQK